MINIRDDLIYNLDYIVIAPNADKSVFEGLEYSFGNVVPFDGSIEKLMLFRSVF